MTAQALEGSWHRHPEAVAVAKRFVNALDNDAEAGFYALGELTRALMLLGNPFITDEARTDLEQEIDDLLDEYSAAEALVSLAGVAHFRSNRGTPQQTSDND